MTVNLCGKEQTVGFRDQNARRVSTEVWNTPDDVLNVHCSVNLELSHFNHFLK